MTTAQARKARAQTLKHFTRHHASKGKERMRVTLRLPVHLADRLLTTAFHEGKTMNDLIIELLER